MTAAGHDPSAHRRLLEAARARHREIETRPLAADISVALDGISARHGSQCALHCIDEGGRALDYAQLRDGSLRAAAGLRRLGVGPGVRVALLMPNAPEFLLAWLAILRLGAVAVPLNPALTAAEVDHCIGLARPSCAILAAEVAEGLTDSRPLWGCDLTRVVLGGGLPGAVPWEGVSTQERVAAADLPAPDLDRLATILFTSGTTGFPKAVLHSHRFWLTMGRALAARGPRVMRILGDVPLFYLAGLWRFMMALEHGGTLFLARHYSLSRLVHRIDAHRIDFFTANDMVARSIPEGWRPAHPIVRVNIAGLSPALHARVERLFAAPAREGYGMTEAGAVLYMPFENGLMTGSGACGIPSPYRSCSIRDPAGRDVPRGAAGELWVRGPGLCAGYVDDPEATSALFRDGWLRTGDLFRQDELGYYHLCGRLKDMIRRSGENIAAREVETALTELDAVIEAAVIGVPDPARGQEVMACLRLAHGWTAERLPPAAVLSHCRHRLARFKIPRYLQYVQAFPRTASNKIAKAQLPDGQAPVYDSARHRWTADSGHAPGDATPPPPDAARP
jgi:crotonobetaine/carnitine-CoA ligase